MDVLAAFIGNKEIDKDITPFSKSASTGPQHFVRLHRWLSMWRFVILLHLRLFGDLSGQNIQCVIQYHIMKQIPTQSSMIFSLLTQVITKLSGSGYM
jgi:hypothetical protein